MSEHTQPTGATAYSGTATGQPDHTTPPYSDRPVAFRGPDSLGGLLLILAGIAAAISLPLSWLAAADISGLDLVRAGFETPQDIYDEGLWQPMTVIFGGGLLLVLGILMWLPAKTHRTLGVLGLVVSVAAGVGILVPLADDGWDLATYDLGFWFAVAVPVLGLLGSLKAMFTGPRYPR
ncbi:hypothetical protein [Blastococcus sp. PRF04-17]|uniref:hypothetical protein n=1 Tax=Blastococcus sp. PRF04-17 TaxID=2933797 RepID=UPI001FF1E021|nr:hypothetical protein [Blastococcus sp. PRF04-17]UOY01130.1 hypothetical protein MVA48_19565 [Blastococcus sp. PRF04-17]